MAAVYDRSCCRKYRILCRTPRVCDSESRHDTLNCRMWVSVFEGLLRKQYVQFSYKEVHKWKKLSNTSA